MKYYNPRPAIDRLVNLALLSSKENARFVYVAPPANNGVKDIAWPYLKYVTKYVTTNIREARMEVTLARGVVISIDANNHPDSLRGLALSGAVIDEIIPLED